jgi:hypothetical protein
VVRLPNGRFRGFSANVTTYAIDGDSPWDMAGTPMTVLGPAPRGQYGESGEWINHVERSDNRLLAWVHDETGDRFGTAITSVKSMSIAVSENDGKSWRRLGQIITGTQGVVQGEVTGVGDGDAVDGKDGFYYLYAWWNRHPGGVIVARAPVTNPGLATGRDTLMAAGASRVWAAMPLGVDKPSLPIRSSSRVGTMNRNLSKITDRDANSVRRHPSQIDSRPLTIAGDRDPE